MFVQEVALVSETNAVKSREVMKVAAALQRQARRDFEPIWSVPASVSAFDSLDDVPVGYWPIIVRDDIGFEGAAGIHLDNDGQPFSLVQASPDWALTASHEMLEMLADPFGNRLIASTSIQDQTSRVEYLVEVSDPSEAANFGYTVNGILLSDFYTPNFFDPVKADGVRYSFTGAIKEPRQVLPGGYISWHDPVSDHWFQAQFFTSQLKFVDLGVFDGSNASLRSWIDSKTNKMSRAPKGPSAAGLKEAMLMSGNRIKKLDDSSGGKAARLRAQIAALVKP